MLEDDTGRRAPLQGLGKEELVPRGCLGRQDQPTRRPGTDKPGWREEQERHEDTQDRPGEHPVVEGRKERREHRRLHQERLGQLSQCQHERPHPCVVLDLQVGEEEEEGVSNSRAGAGRGRPGNTGRNACASWRKTAGPSIDPAASARSRA